MFVTLHLFLYLPSIYGWFSLLVNKLSQFKERYMRVQRQGEGKIVDQVMGWLMFGKSLGNQS